MRHMQWGFMASLTLYLIIPAICSIIKACKIQESTGSSMVALNTKFSGGMKMVWHRATARILILFPIFQSMKEYGQKNCSEMIISAAGVVMVLTGILTG